MPQIAAFHITAAAASAAAAAEEKAEEAGLYSAGGGSPSYAGVEERQGVWPAKQRRIGSPRGQVQLSQTG